MMEWTTRFIKMWKFARNAVPQSLASGKPDADTFGALAFATETGSCVIDTHFLYYQITTNTDFVAILQVRIRCGNKRLVIRITQRNTKLAKIMLLLIQQCMQMPIGLSIVLGYLTGTKARTELGIIVFL